MASDLLGRDEANFFAGRWDEIEESNEQAQSRKPRKGIKDDPYKVVVAAALEAVMPKLAGPNYFFGSFLPNLSKRDSAYNFGGSSELMPDNMTQAGRLEHPDYFYHSGFETVEGTNAAGAGGAINTYDQGYVPNEHRGPYEAEKEVRRAVANRNTSKKVASLLQKIGIASPPAVAGDGYGDEFPNGPNDIHGTDQERISRADMIQPKFTRSQNLSSTRTPSKSQSSSTKTAVESAAAAGAGGGSDSFTLETKPAKEQKTTQMKPKDLMGGKPRRTSMDALRTKPYTEGTQYDKIPQGFPDFDPKFPNAKIASLLKKAGF
jgi:hypothetical protein